MLCIITRACRKFSRNSKLSPSPFNAFLVPWCSIVDMRDILDR